MITIYHNPRCRKSRETLAMVEASGQPYEVIEYLKTPPNRDELVKLLHQLHMKPEELVRKGEEIWKSEFKGKTLGDDEILSALSRYPRLIERPIVVKGSEAILGRPPENVIPLLGGPGPE
jgi:arsenate reductase